MNVGEGDEIVLTWMEHHANIVPWQMLAERKGATIRVAEIDDDGVLDLNHLTSLLGPRTKLLAFTHVSNALGRSTRSPSSSRSRERFGITTLVDGAQACRISPSTWMRSVRTSTSSRATRSSDRAVPWSCKRFALLDAMPPFLGRRRHDRGRLLRIGTTFAPVPQKFEAGTPDIASVIGFGAAIDSSKGSAWMRSPPTSTSCGVRHGGNSSRGANCGSSVAKEKAAVLSFVLE